ncbi:MAG: NADH-quinone oxidoreductase subunit K [Candidatus Ozemobacteraceae bacterium]
MNAETASLLHLYSGLTLLMIVTGLYCIMATRNMIRVLIGIELITKGVTLLIIIAGKVSNHMASAQAITITVIIIEVVLVPVVAGLILGVFRHNRSLNVGKLRQLHG